MRGEGLLIGLKSVVPNGELADACRAEKLLSVLAGDNVMRLVPPLIVTEDDHVMALDAKHLDVEQLKWIVLMVLFNLPGYENAYFSMEDLVDEDVYGVLH